MSEGLNIRRLRAEDAAAFVTLRREALETEPLAFAASAEDDRGLSPDFVRTALADDQEQAIFGQFEGADLTGMIGLIRGSKAKERHKGSLWGMYVAPRARNRGVGRALLEAAIQQARGWGLGQLQLGVTEAALSAKRLYEAAGFRSWGREPRALQWNGRFIDDHHLALDLRGPVAPLDEEAIKKVLATYVETWNRHDVAAWGRLFTDDVDYINRVGGWWRSNRDNVEGHERIHGMLVKQEQTMTYTSAVAKITFLAPDIALVHATWEWPGFTTPAGEGLKDFTGIITMVMMKRDEQWLIRALQNTVTSSPSLSEHLRKG